MNKITESAIEQYAIDLLEKQGYSYIYGPDIAPDSETPIRQSFEEVLLPDKLKTAIAKINSTIHTNTRDDAIYDITITSCRGFLGSSIREVLIMTDSTSNFLLYTAADGKIKIDVFVQDETVWLTQKAMAELFGVNTPAINKHLKNIFETGELQKEATISILETVQSEGNRQVSRKVEYYNLDAIIAVGYRVNSYQATQFRIWATKTLKEFIIKGFVLDDERLKQGKTVFGRDYFEELLLHRTSKLITETLNS